MCSKRGRFFKHPKISMQPSFHRLHSRGRDSRGLVVGHEGAMVGPDCALVRRTATGFRCVAGKRRTSSSKSHSVIEGGWLFDVGCRVASALNAGNVALAQICGVHAASPINLNDEQVVKLSEATIAKAGYNPDEPRDWHGRWTTGEDAADTQIADMLTERKNRYIDQCWGILLLKKPYRWRDINLVEFQRCVDDCMKGAE